MHGNSEQWWRQGWSYGAKLGLNVGNTELGNQIKGDVEDESYETTLCVESEAMLRHLEDKSKLLTQDFVYWCNQQRLKSKASGGE